MAAGYYDVVIEQGATFSLSLTYKDSTGAAINLTGFTARSKFKPSFSGTAVASLTNVSGITLGGAAGTIVIVISASDTAAITAPSSGVYDLEIVSSGGVVTRLLEGKYTVTPEVTT